jgi:hypothetical protein
MKRLVSFVVSFLLLPSAASPATYYVSKTGGNTAPYGTWAKAANQIRTVIDYIRTNGLAGNTVYIAEGVYTTNAYVLLDNDNLQNLTIIGAGEDATILNPSDKVFNVTNGDGLSVRGLTCIPSTGQAGIFLNDTSGTFEFTNVNIQAPYGYTQYLLNLQAGNLTFSRGVLRHEYDTSNNRSPILVSNAANATFNYSFCVAAPHAGDSNTVLVNTSGTVAFNNCVILDSGSHGIQFYGSGTYSVTNSIINGGLRNGSAYTIYRSNGALTLTNNIIISNPWDGDGKWITGAYTDGGGNLLTNANPKFVQYPRRGYILPCVDDTGNFTYAQSLETLLASHGFKGTFFLEQVSWNTNNNAPLRTMVENGTMEVAIHSYTHSDLSLTGKIFEVTKTAETITIDRDTDGGTITLSDGSSIIGFKTKTLAAIKTELESLGATVTPSSIYSTAFSVGGKVYSLALGEVIANGNGVNQIDLLIDDTGASGYFKTEMADPKTWLANTVVNGAGNVADGQTAATYVCNSFGLPYNTNVTEARTAGRTLNFTNLRGMYSKNGISNAPFFLNNLDVYQIFCIGAPNFLKGDGTETNVRYNARALAFAVAQSGLSVAVLSHNSSELTMEQWAWILDEWSDFSDAITVTSNQLFVQDVQSRFNDNGDGTFSHTFSANDGDFRLQPYSPCIDSGTDVGLTEDYAGNRVPKGDGADIGAYESNFTEPIPVPKQGQVILCEPSETPILGPDPQQAVPIGIGPVAIGSDTLRLHLGLNSFAAPMEIYFGIFMYKLDQANLYVLTPDLTFRPQSMGIVPWKTNVTDSIDDNLFGDIPISSLPLSTYVFYLCATPSGQGFSGGFYLWSTTFEIERP